jgi:hypothetical protein
LRLIAVESRQAATLLAAYSGRTAGIAHASAMSSPLRPRNRRHAHSCRSYRRLRAVETRWFSARSFRWADEPRSAYRLRSSSLGNCSGDVSNKKSGQPQERGAGPIRQGKTQRASTCRDRGHRDRGFRRHPPPRSSPRSTRWAPPTPSHSLPPRVPRQWRQSRETAGSASRGFPRRPW